MEVDQKVNATWPDGKCPFESQVVVCGSCSSDHFSIDPQSPRSRKRVPGICDDCGYRFGAKVKVVDPG